MHKISPWLFLVIALMWLLPMVGVATDPWGSWVSVIALAVVGILEMMRSK